MIRIDWEYPEVPEYDPDIHNPEKVFAFMCYRGVHYAKWVYLNIFMEGSSWNLNNPGKMILELTPNTHPILHEKYVHLINVLRKQTATMLQKF